jgi:hypothetical protein
MKKNSSSDSGFQDYAYVDRPGCCCFSLRLKSSFKDFRRLENCVALGFKGRKVEGFTSFRWKNPPPVAQKGGRIHRERWKDSPPPGGRIHLLKEEEITPFRWKKTPSQLHCQSRKAGNTVFFQDRALNTRFTIQKITSVHFLDIGKVEGFTSPPRSVMRKVEESTPLLKVEANIDMPSTVGMISV